MSKKIKAQDLGDAIAQELTIYHEDVLEKVNRLGEEAIQRVVKITKATAPVGNRGDFRKNITSSVKKGKRGHKYVWHVKAPDYRLTHLLVKGHMTKNGTDRTKADPFLANALDQVLPRYEKDVEEACK